MRRIESRVEFAANHVLAIDAPRRRLTGLKTATSRLTLGFLLVAAGLTVSFQAQAATANVSTAEQLANAISNSNIDVINFLTDITLDRQLPDVNRNITINGAGKKLSGADTYPGFLVGNADGPAVSPTVQINSLTIANTLAKGGDGANGGANNKNQTDGGGGGGAGLGGGLVVLSGANVTLSGVSFQNSKAQGGAGGGVTQAVNYEWGGGGGGGWSGRVGTRNGQSPTSTFKTGKGHGGIPGGGDGAQNGSTGVAGGFGGGGGGAGNTTAAGGVGNFAGGGGGSGFSGPTTPITSAFGGGSGGRLDGGGGAGLGGAIFVQAGGNLTIDGSTTIQNNTVAGGRDQQSTATGTGKAYGSGLFLAGDGALTLNPANGVVQTISDAIADQKGSDSNSVGSWSLVKNGAGTTVLTGANAYSGGTTINAGVLEGNSTGLVGNIVDKTSLVFNQTATGSNAANISGAGSVTKTGAGMLTVTGGLTYSGGTTVNQGVLLFGGSSVPATGALLVDGGAVGNAAGNTASFSKAVTVGPTAGSGFYSASGTNLNVTGVVSGGQLTTVGGGDVTLLGANTFSAANITSGVLRFNTDANLGAAGGLIFLNNGGAVGTTTATNLIAPIARQILLVGNGGINVMNNPLTWSGVISGAGQFIKNGTGELWLTGANTYAGGTNVAQGTLRVESDSALGAPAAGVTLSGGRFRASNDFTSARGFTFSGNTSAIAVDPTRTLTLSGVLSGGAFRKDDTGTLELTGANNTYAGVTITAGTIMGSAGGFKGFTTFNGGANPVSVNFNETTSGSYAGVISGAGSVLKTGPGTTTLAGANTYTGGTTVAAGVLKGTTSSLQGNIANNAEVDFDQTIAGAYSGIISGGGVVGVSGSGSVMLIGQNTYTGLTRVSGGGTLLLGSSNDLGSTDHIEIAGGRVGVASGTGVDLSKAVTISAPGPSGFYAAQGAAMTVTGVVSGGVLTNTGAGDVTLAANNTFTGLSVAAGRTLFTTDANLGQAGSGITLAGGVLALTPAAAPALTINRSLSLSGSAGGIEVDKNLLNWSGPVTGGALTKSGMGNLQLTGANNYSGLVISAGTVLVDSAAELPHDSLTILDGTLRATNDIVFTGAQTVTDKPGATISVDGGKKLTLQNRVTGLGYLTKDGPGTLVLDGKSSLGNAITILDGTLVGNTASWSDNKSIVFGSNSNSRTLIFDQIANGTYGGVITGDGTLIKEGAGALTLSGSASNQTLFTGPIIIGAGTLIANSFSVKTNNIANNGTLVFDQPNISDRNQQIYSGNVAGSGAFIKEGPGRLNITGTSTFGAGATIAAGLLSVNGQVTSLPFFLVGKDGVLGGNPKLIKTNNLDIEGIVAPGNSIGTITVEGNMTIHGTAEMEVAADGTNDQIIVTGSPPLGHLTLTGDTLRAIFLPGLYSPRTYHLMSATSGITGDVGNFETENLPPNFIPFAFNTENDVYLKLTAALGYGDPLSVNQQGIVGPLNSIYNATGVLPSNFANLYGLSGAQLTSALDQTTGEVATGARQTSVQMTNQFLSLMLDPFVDGRAGTAGFDAPPVLGMTSAPTTSSLSYAPNDALPTHKAPMLAPVVEPHWTAWASAYGGASHVSGDPWGVGSHSLDASAGGGAAGLDYHLSPATVLGFAMGGAGGHWSLANGLGSGNTTALQVGIYGATHWGPAYIGGALSFTNNWASTNRNAVGENLKADFDAQSYGARVETGYRFATPFGAVTPYVAGQAQSFHSPGYAEQGFFLNSFALGYGSLTDANERSELGLRFDRVAPMGDMTIAFRGRLAWAHDWFSNPSIGATFIDVLGAGFVVAGATPSRDLALISAGLDLQLAKGVSLQAKFDTELGSKSTTYAGTGTLRYAF